MDNVADRAPDPQPASLPSQIPKPSDCINYLPPELRIKVWSCAAEPQIILFSDLVQIVKSYPIPTVTHVNAEARIETLRGYELAGRGSYVHFARDILVCDYKLVEQTSPEPLDETLAARAERVVFCDCFPDERRIEVPDRYFNYLKDCYEQTRFGQVFFDRFWFPNVQDFWCIKIGDVDESWKVQFDKKAPVEVQLQQSAREFRYWVHANIIEIAPLSLDDPDLRLILRESRCGRENCQELNAGRPRIISKVQFVDGKYEPLDDGKKWVRIMPSGDDGSEAPDSCAAINRMRWSLVERSLTYLLRWEWTTEFNGHCRRSKQAL